MFFPFFDFFNIDPEDVMAQRSNSFAYGTPTAKIERTLSIYPAFISKIVYELKQLITVSDHIKNDIEYKNTFHGKEVVVRITI